MEQQAEIDHTAELQSSDKKEIPSQKEQLNTISKWPTPTINSPQWRERLQSATKVEIVVHPLYKMLFEDVRWHMADSSSRDVLATIQHWWIEAWVVQAAQAILLKIKEWKESGVRAPAGIMALRDLMEEYAEYKKSDPWTLRIFMLPNYDDILKETREYDQGKTFVDGRSPIIDAYTIFLNDLGWNSLVMDSVLASNWEILPQDRELLRQTLRPGTVLELQGWYNGGCVKDAAQHLQDVSATKQLLLQVDHRALTEWVIQTEWFWNKELYPDATSQEVITMPAWNIDQRKIDEVINYLKENNTFIDKLSAKEREFYNQWEYSAETWFTGMKVNFVDQEKMQLDQRLEQQLKE